MTTVLNILYSNYKLQKIEKYKTSLVYIKMYFPRIVFKLIFRLLLILICIFVQKYCYTSQALFINLLKSCTTSILQKLKTI